jgi:hypothetical protein
VAGEGLCDFPVPKRGGLYAWPWGGQAGAYRGDRLGHGLQRVLWRRGARAIDEYKAALYYRHIREWTDREGISCFYFEAFDEQWKDAANPLGSENHFGLINLQSQAKFVLWDLVEDGTFEGLTRDGKPITRTFDGDREAMMETVQVPPTEQEIMNMHQ